MPLTKKQSQEYNRAAKLSIFFEHEVLKENPVGVLVV